MLTLFEMLISNKERMKFIIAVLIVYSSASFAQNFMYVSTLGNFNKASSFYISADGLIYVTDAGKDELYMIDTLGNVLKTFGGYGWNENSLDDPRDVFADPLTVYVADKNNHRVKRFDKNLNFISSLYTRDSDDFNKSFGYPLSCATSNQGDLYVLDSENKRVIDFDIYGNYKQNFGGFDAGNFMLNNPTQLAIASNNNIYVIDSDKIVVYDQFGNGVQKINCGFELRSIRILFNNLVVTSDDKILFANLNLPDVKLSEIKLLEMENPLNIVSAIYFNNKLFILSTNSVHLFKQIK